MSGFLTAWLITDFITVWAGATGQAGVVKYAVVILPGNLFLHLFSIAAQRKRGLAGAKAGLLLHSALSNGVVITGSLQYEATAASLLQSLFKSG